MHDSCSKFRQVYVSYVTWTAEVSCHAISIKCFQRTKNIYILLPQGKKHVIGNENGENIYFLFRCEIAYSGFSM